MGRRYLCWDKKLMDENGGVQVVMHKPEKKDIALYCNDLWEGVYNGYAGVIKVGDVYRLYYRAGKYPRPTGCVCVAESRDGGRTFQKLPVNRIEFEGCTENDIIMTKPIEEYFDNFSIFYDTNPACPAEERFKALCSEDRWPYRRLMYYASEDGLRFEPKRLLELEGRFDSYNVTFWDEQTGQYFLYYRGYHDDENPNIQTYEEGLNDENSVRDVRVATSPDFVHWTQHGLIQTEEGQAEMPMYTNQVSRYYRAEDTFIGFPVRYIDRRAEKENLRFMPHGEKRMAIACQESGSREATAQTDCLIMTSRDGFTFDRRDEAYMTCGPENNCNWWYGCNYTAYGLVETPADEEGAPNEISFYAGDGYAVANVHFRRYTTRLDGFFSWYGNFGGGTVLTRPLTVDGEELRLNFATSAAGGVKIALCDEGGTPIEGYASYAVYGDAVDRPVEFAKPLSALKGQTVRLRIFLQDAHLYSFIFV